MKDRIQMASTRAWERIYMPAFVCLACLLVHPGRSRGGERLKDRVSREYPQAVARLEKRFANIDGRARYTRLLWAGTTKEKRLRSTLTFEKRGAKRATRRTWEEDDKQGRAIEQVRCYNPEKYAFEAVRYAKGSPLIVRGMSAGPGNFEDHYGVYVARHAEAMYSVFGIPISRLMADPSFSILGVAETTVNGKRLLRIQYYFRPESGRDVSIILRSGWIETDPDQDWIIRRYESQLKPEFKGVTVSGEVEYRRDEQAGISVPSRSVAHSPDGIHTMEFSYYRVGDALGDGHFTLASFGIPEVDRFGRRDYGGQPFYWLLGAAALSLLLAVSTRYASSRLGARVRGGRPA